MADKEKIHQILSSLWKNDDSVGKMCYNQALQDVQTAIDLQEDPKTDWLQELQKRLDSLSKEDFKNVMAKYSRYGEEEPVSMWHDVSEEPVSEELDIAATEYSSQNKFFLKPTDFLAFDSLSCCAKDSFIIGANWQKEQLMASGTDVTVHVDAGGYPYIPQIELYDYDKDIPLAKEGDKYKVVLIKED